MEDGIPIPTHLKPELYQIELLPFIIQNNVTIQGKLELTMLCEQESTNVTLHTKNLVLDEENIELVSLKNGKKISIVEHSYDTDHEFYIAKLSQTLKEGTQYKISINYVTQLTNEDKGFYYAVSEERYYASIQIQAIGAQSFPRVWVKFKPMLMAVMTPPECLKWPESPSLGQAN